MNEDTFIDLSLGFYVRDRDLSEFDQKSLLDHGGDWQTVAAVNLMCREGNFSKLDKLVAILDRSEDTEIWDAIVNLIGFAGGWDTIYRAFQRFESKLQDHAVRYNMAVMLGSSCDVRAVAALLRLYRLSDPADEAADQIIRELSDLLEPTNQAIFYSRHRQPDHKDLVDLVNRQSASLKIEGNKIFESETLNVILLAKRLLERLGASELQRERFSRGRLVFEAATGVNCSGFFDDLGRLNRLEAIGVLEDFLDGDHPEFVPGQRYFFGHPISD